MRGDGAFRDDSRAARGCTRFDLPHVPWDVNAALLRVGYMGRPPVVGVTEEEGRPINPHAPLERPSDGCPGGWYRSRFVWSLHRYMRVRTEHGGRVSNALLDRADDLIVACEQVFVREQERFVARRLQELQK